jgi:xylulokinase
MKPTHWLAFDVGTSGVKVAIVNNQITVLASAYREYSTYSPGKGIVEQDVADWWRAAADAAGELRQHPTYRDIAAIALTGQMQDVILIDAQGNPTRRALLYSDMRAHDEAQEINKTVGVENLQQLTGNEQDASTFPAKLLWLKRHEPDTLLCSRYLLFGAADYLAFKLTGQAAVDTTTAATTGLLNLQTRQLFDDDILKTMNIAEMRHLLPVVLSGGTKVGSLHRQAAEALDLADGIPVYLGPGDAGATTIGAGSGEPGSAYGYIGSSGWVAFTDTQPGNPQQGVFTLAHPRQGYYIQVAPLLTAGGNLDWMQTLIGNDDYAGTIDTALQRPATSLLYLPYLNGERSPIRDPLARGAFIGLSQHTDMNDLYRAVLEGVVFAYRHALAALASDPIDHITLTGGGSRSNPWCQLFADVLGIPVTIAQDAAFVGVRGAVQAAQVNAGMLRDYRSQHDGSTSVMLHPDPSLLEHYDRQYELFRELYPALKSVFARMT